MSRPPTAPDFPFDIEHLIGTRLTRLRSQRGLTQEQLAEAVGVTKGYVSKIENARSVPPIGTSRADSPLRRYAQ